MKQKRIVFDSDGYRLVGILHMPDKPTDKVIVMAHGFTVTKDEAGLFVRAANAFNENGWAAFRFDFRGCGESKADFKDTTVETEAADLNHAIEFVETQGYKNIGLLGASFGGAVCIYGWSPKIRTMVLWNPVTDLYETFVDLSWFRHKTLTAENIREIETTGLTMITKKDGSKFNIGKKIWEEFKTMKLDKHMKRITCPTLFLHGDKDTKVPFSQTERNYKLIKNSELVKIEGSEHGFHGDASEKKVIDASLAWFRKYL